MQYAELVDVYERLEATSATLEKTEILASTLASDDDEHLAMLVKLVRGKVFENWESEERAAKADEWEPEDSRPTPDGFDLGNHVTESVSQKYGREISRDLNDLDNYERDADPSGRYFDHDGTFIVFTMIFEE